MIEIINLTKNYGSFKALDNVSLKIDTGESVCLLGENGAGKSTLIKCILGMLEFTGTIKINTNIINTALVSHKLDIGYIPQEPVFYDMKVNELLSFFATLRKSDRNRIDDSLNITGLTEHMNKRTSELSGGLKQRLSFAIALLSDPPVLILDEPTSNLDAYARLDLMKLVKELKVMGKTVLFSSHRLDEVELLADRVYILKKGKVINESTEKNLIDNLGLKTKIILLVDNSKNEAAVRILKSIGINTISQNGAGISINVENSSKLRVMKQILGSQIELIDLRVEAPTMDEIIRSL